MSVNANNAIFTKDGLKVTLITFEDGKKAIAITDTVPVTFTENDLKRGNWTVIKENILNCVRDVYSDYLEYGKMVLEHNTSDVDDLP